MRNGISAGPLPAGLPYGEAIQKAAESCFVETQTEHGVEITRTFSSLVAYAAATNETIQGEINKEWIASTVISPDGGHGLLQLTSYVPPNWQDPFTNALVACEHWFIPAEAFWSSPPYSLSGNELVKAILADFNEGLTNELRGHLQYGDLDHFTTADYGQRGLEHYLALLSGKSPLIYPSD